MAWGKKSIPAGWLIPVGVLFVISFPPLFGHEVRKERPRLALVPLKPKVGRAWARC